MHVGCFLPGKWIMCLFALRFSYFMCHLRTPEKLPWVVSRVPISKHFGVDVFDLHCSLPPGLWPMLFIPSLFFLRCFWTRGFVSYSTGSRVRGGSNAKLWYVHISLQSVYLPQRPDSEWHSYKQWVKDLMCTIQTSCHGLDTCTWLKNKHLTCINICIFSWLKSCVPVQCFLEDLQFILPFSQNPKI